MSTLKKFLESRQVEVKTDDEVRGIIMRHEPDQTLRLENCLSFEGFARYMMDKDNYAFVNERVIQSSSNMDRPLSQYYIASSHNTYLTGHQLKGESSVELYSQVGPPSYIFPTNCNTIPFPLFVGAPHGMPLR